MSTEIEVLEDRITELEEVVGMMFDNVDNTTINIEALAEAINMLNDRIDLTMRVNFGFGGFTFRR